MLQSLGKNFLLLKGIIISNHIGVTYFLDILRGGSACFCFALHIGQKYFYFFIVKLKLFVMSKAESNRDIFLSEQCYYGEKIGNAHFLRRMSQFAQYY